MKTNSPFNEAAKLLVFTVATSGRRCGIRELKNHGEVHDDDVCWPGKDWKVNVSFGGKKET